MKDKDLYCDRMALELENEVRRHLREEREVAVRFLKGLERLNKCQKEKESKRTKKKLSKEIRST